MSKFKNVKVGDKVYCLMNGEGEVISINKSAYPLRVSFEFESCKASYTYEGREISRSKTPMLYWEKPEIIEKKRTRKVTKYKVVYKDINGILQISQGYYKDENHFLLSFTPFVFDSLILSTAKEFEEEF